MNRRDILKGLAAAPVLLQVPSGRKDIITFAQEKEIITNIIEADMYKVGPNGVISWDVTVDHNLRLSDDVRRPLADPDVILGKSFIQGNISFYLESAASVEFLNKAIDGRAPIRMEIPTSFDQLRSSEFLAIVENVSFHVEPQSFITSEMSFVVVGEAPRFYEST